MTKKNYFSLTEIYILESQPEPTFSISITEQQVLKHLNCSQGKKLTLKGKLK